MFVKCDVGFLTQSNKLKFYQLEKFLEKHSVTAMNLIPRWASLVTFESLVSCTKKRHLHLCKDSTE